MTNFSSSTFRKFVFVFNNHLQHVFIEKVQKWFYLDLSCIAYWSFSFVCYVANTCGRGCRAICRPGITVFPCEGRMKSLFCNVVELVHYFHHRCRCYLNRQLLHHRHEWNCSILPQQVDIHSLHSQQSSRRQYRRNETSFQKWFSLSKSEFLKHCAVIALLFSEILRKRLLLLCFQCLFLQQN